MTDTFKDLRDHKWGLAALLFGGIALIISMVVIFAGPFAPQQSVGTSIGKIIGEISLSAMNTVRGEALPAPVAPAWNIDRVLVVTGPVMAVLGFLAAIVSALHRDPWRLPTYGVTLGVAAIAIQFIWWVALLIAGTVLLVSILENGANFLDL